MKKPFVKLIELYNNNYLYDVNKNEVIKINKKAYEDISSVLSGQSTHYTTFEVDELINDGFLSSEKPEKIEHQLSQYIGEYLDYRIQHIALQITQNCNFKCRYCGYAGDGYLDRTHTEARMSLETAQKAVRFLSQHSGDLNNVKIYFYGGEPLLEYDVVKGTILYAKKIMPHKTINFIISTNLSCLTDDMLEFFIDNNVKIIVSVDGPEFIHNKYRRFASNGEGTFDVVNKKINRIFNKNLDFLSTNVFINCVIDKIENINEIQRFFSNKPYSYIDVAYTPLDPARNGMKTTETEVFKEQYYVNMFAAHISNFSAETNKDSKHTRVLFSSFSDYPRFCEQLKLKGGIKIAHHQGQCIPGQSKLFVTTTGKLITCEKASDKSDMMKIGTLDDGFDYQQANRILNIGKVTENECKNCWAIRFCSMCAIHCDNYNEFSVEMKRNMCKKEQHRVANLLKDYIVFNDFKK